MGNINTEYKVRGRPVYGAEAKTIERKFRIEPYMDDQLTWICLRLAISRSEAIRQGIKLLIREYKKHHDY